MLKSSFIDVPALLFASAVGGIWIWSCLLLSGQEVVGSVLLLVLLLPFLGLTSSIAIALFILPLWWLLRRTAFSAPYFFVLPIALLTEGLALVAPQPEDQSSLQRLLLGAYSAIWLCSMAAVYSMLARRQAPASLSEA
ncbi:hypothetical protein [Aquabacterium humicola]|uniref:hypothetical protein n=1 Tax=Aquabacterium humicola TaxID=3237377 RepID=UPI002543484C|nr:hypothetical protein [Rubrivivax pictus]